MDNLCGNGTYGNVFVLESEPDSRTGSGSDSRTGSKIARKVYKNNNSYYESDYISEVAILKYLQHPNIITLKKYTPSKLEFDMELAEGTIDKLFPMDLNMRKYIFYQIFLGVDYCHRMGIRHLDLKYQNIVYFTSGYIRSQNRDFENSHNRDFENSHNKDFENSQNRDFENSHNSNFDKYEIKVKLIDFGLADSYIQPNNYNGICPYILRAPEVCLDGPYNELADIWSLGVLLYNAITGIRCPNNGIMKWILYMIGIPKSEDLVIEKTIITSSLNYNCAIKNMDERLHYYTNKYNQKNKYRHHNYENVIDSTERTFLRKMLCWPGNRISATNALKDDYFSGEYSHGDIIQIPHLKHHTELMKRVIPASLSHKTVYNYSIPPFKSETISNINEWLKSRKRRIIYEWLIVVKWNWVTDGIIFYLFELLDSLGQDLGEIRFNTLMESVEFIYAAMIITAKICIAPVADFPSVLDLNILLKEEDLEEMKYISKSASIGRTKLVEEYISAIIDAKKFNLIFMTPFQLFSHLRFEYEQFTNKNICKFVVVCVASVLHFPSDDHIHHLHRAMRYLPDIFDLTEVKCECCDFADDLFDNVSLMKNIGLDYNITGSLMS